jgi:hypothetical protein
MIGPKLPPRTIEEQQLAQIQDLQKLLENREQEIQNLKPTPQKGKGNDTQPYNPDEGETSAADDESGESDANGVFEDNTITAEGPKYVRDPGPSRQPGLLPHHNPWCNPELMRRSFEIVRYLPHQAQHSPEQPGQHGPQASNGTERAARKLDLNEDYDDNGEEDTNTPVASASRPRVRPATNPAAKPDWGQPLSTPQVPEGHVDDDCIIVGVNLLNGSHILASRSELAVIDPNSDAHSDVVHNPRASG